MAVCIFVTTTKGQAPSAIIGDSFGVDVTSGNGSFPGAGHYLLLPANSGAGYQIIGVGGSVNSSGTYSFSKSNAFGLLNLTDNHLGSVKGSADFAMTTSGTITLKNGTTQETGNFEFAAGTAPTALAGHTYYIQINDGSLPFANTGRAIFTPSPTGNGYTVTPNSGGIAASSGTYSYGKFNNSTGKFTLNDSATGASTEYFSFESANAGFYLVTEPSGGFQVGTFTVSNMIPAQFFAGQVDVSSKEEFLQFPDGTPFGHYDVMDFKFPLFYHFDMGFESFFDAQNSANGCYLYDFTSKTFFYTDPTIFPMLYDFTLNTWLYYFPDSNRPGHYTSNPRFFWDFATGQVIRK